MLKTFLLSLLTLLIIPAFTQQIQLGIKSGLNLSTTSLQEEGIETGYLPGYVFGLSAMFGSDFYFQPEILYIRKGMVVDSVANADNYKFKNTYWEFPLLLNYGAGGEKFRIFANFGPFISYWSRGKVEADINGELTEYAYDFDDDFDDGYEDDRWDFGFCAGGGVGLKISSGWIYFEARYHNGFSDIRTLEAADVDYKPVRNKTISGTLSYLHRL